MLHCQPIFNHHLSRTLLSCGALFLVNVTAAAAADPTGDWRVADGVANIRVAECNGSMWGAVAWEKTPGGIDKNNPDASKRSRPTLGIVTLFNMKKKKGAEEWEGEVYDAQSTGRRYNATIKPKDSDKLEIQGCLLFFCDGQTWTRASGPIASSPANVKAGTKTGTMAPVSPRPALPPKTSGQKAATSGQMADIGDICLLPEIASSSPANR